MLTLPLQRRLLPCGPLVRFVGTIMLLIAAHSPAFAEEAGEPAWFSRALRWTASAPLVEADTSAADACHAVKDPSIIFHNGSWQIFATAKCRGQTRMEHVALSDLKPGRIARRSPISLVDSYHCAPQVFYFRPHKKWYLIYQWGDDSRNYFGPCYSTLDDPARPETLTRPQMLYPAKPEGTSAWLDFWVICDGAKAHLFFTSLNGRTWRAETILDAFPHGWSDPLLVLQGDIFEASHTYRLKGLNQYLTIIEAQGPSGSRYYKAYRSDRLDGSWQPVADSRQRPFAGAANIEFAASVQPWTDSVSHGELLRDGVDETMTVDPKELRMLFQGCSAQDRQGKGYGQFPWRLGLLELSAPLAEPGQ